MLAGECRRCRCSFLGVASQTSSLSKRCCRKKLGNTDAFKLYVIKYSEKYASVNNTTLHPTLFVHELRTFKLQIIKAQGSSQEHAASRLALKLDQPYPSVTTQASRADKALHNTDQHRLQAYAPGRSPRPPFPVGLTFNGLMQPTHPSQVYFRKPQEYRTHVDDH